MGLRPGTKSRTPPEVEMAIRKKLRLASHAEEVREKISVSQIINRLEGWALGTLKNDMTPSQIKAAEILLGKAMPDLGTIKKDVEAQSVTFNLITTAKK